MNEGRAFVDVEDDYGFDIPTEEDVRTELVSSESDSRTRIIHRKAKKGGNNGREKPRRLGLYLEKETYDFVYMFARSKGMSMNEYLATLLAKEIKKNQEFFNKYVTEFNAEFNG